MSGRRDWAAYGNTVFVSTGLVIEVVSNTVGVVMGHLKTEEEGLEAWKRCRSGFLKITPSARALGRNLDPGHESSGSPIEVFDSSPWAVASAHELGWNLDPGHESVRSRWICGDGPGAVASALAFKHRLKKGFGLGFGFDGFGVVLRPRRALEVASTSNRACQSKRSEEESEAKARFNEMHN